MTWQGGARDPAPRVIFIGDSGVGKTSIIHRIRTGAFPEASAPTVGTGVTQFSANTDIGHRRFQLWDTAGQEVYRTIIPIYFKGADLAVAVFSLSDRASLASLDGWIEELHANADPETAALVVGNKADAEAGVSEADARRWAGERRFPVLFVSAKTGEGIDALKGEIVDQYLRRKGGARAMHRIELGAPERAPGGCC
jgi:Ras-related protein Rab-5C